MFIDIKDKEVYQFFGDTTYRCVPITLYIISGFNLIMKRTRILLYLLIPNENETTLYVLFNTLKQKYGFNPVLYTMDFQKSLLRQ